MQDLHQVVLSNISDTVLITDDAGAFTYVCPNVAIIFGYSPQEVYALGNVTRLLGNSLFDRNELERVGEIKNIEHTITDRAGQERWLLVNVKRVSIQEGTTLYTCRDITDRKRIEKELGESEARYRMLFDLVPVGLFTKDREGRYTNTNDRNLVYTDKSPIGHTDAELQPPEIAAQLRANDLRVMESGREMAFEERFMAQHGPRFLLSHKTPLRNADDEIMGVLGATLDITKRKQKEEQLRFQADILRNVRDSVIVTDTAGIIQYWNQGAEDIFGHTAEEAIGQPIGILYPQRTQDRFAADLEQILRDGEYVDIWQGEHKDGTTIWVDTRTTPMYDSQGELAGFIGVSKDVTDRKGVEEALRESETRLRALVGSIDEIVFELDAQGTYLNVWTADESLLVQPADELLGQRVRDVLGVEFARPFEEAFQRILATGQSETLEYEVNTMAGRRWFLARVNPIPAPDGELKTLSLLARDITERKQMEEALQAREEQYRTLFETMVQGVVYQNADGEIILANPAAERILGLSLNQMQGRTSHDPRWRAIHEDGTDFPGDTHPAMVALRTGEEVRDVVMGVFNSKQEAYSWINLNAIPLFRPGETEPYQVHTTFEDITERKRTLEALRESEERYRTLFDGAPVALFRTTPDGRILDVNPAMVDMIGYPDRASLLTASTLDFYVDPEERRQWQRTVASKGLVDNFEIRLRRNDGEIIWGLLSARAIRNHAGEVTQYEGALKDVTVRKRVEEQIKLRNRELATLLGVSRQLVSQLDLDELLVTIVHSVVDALPTAEASSLWLCKPTRDKLVARAWAGHDDEAMSDLAVSPDTSLVGLIYQTGEPHIIDDAAEEPAFELLGQPALDTIRSVVGVPLIVENQTIGALFADNHSHARAFGDNDLRLLQSLAGQAAIAIQNARLFEQVHAGRERLRSLSERLVEVQETERRHIAHELHDEIGQALTALKLTLDMTAQQPGHVDQNLNEAQGLVDELMASVRQLSLDLRPGMLDDLGLLPALLWHFERYTDHTRIEVDFQHMGIRDRRFPPNVETVAYRIVQEALTNVARHTDVDQVVVRAWAGEEMLNLQVEDEGAGFDVDAVLEAGGTIGVDGMRERAILVGGDLTIDSTPGAGTSFIASLPLEGYVERRQSPRPSPQDTFT